MVRGGLEEFGRQDLAEAAELLVSEVVTNAVVHAGTSVDLSWSVNEHGLRVEVGDGSPHMPLQRHYAPTAGTGRGIHMLDGMVDDWGVTPTETGKTVWFQLSIDTMQRNTGERARAMAATPPHPADAVAIELLNVPVLLHAAWQQHAQTLLREHLLISMESDEAEAIRVHAEANEALALLAEHIPPPPVTEQPDDVMATAVEPHVSVAHVTVFVPTDSLPHFVTLNDTLDTIAVLTDEGRFLFPPVQPELRSMRRWLCREVAKQSSGKAPTGWAVDDQPEPPTGQAIEWDPTPVSESARALIAADDTNRILAVSRPALEILGYDGPEQLVGERIVAIVPARYRQAHLAGFTLHFLTGRDALIGKPVIVPALRRDGTETEVELTVNAEPVGNGRCLFVAELVSMRPGRRPRP
jgi:PAS domain S-box-containing protein